MAKKILLIEDNESYASVLTQKFAHEELEVIVAGDGQEGIQKAIEHQPNIILIDLLLPKMNGLQVMEEIRKSEWGKHMPLLILTNLNPDEEIKRSIEKNKPAYYLIKPEVKLQDILEKINIILQAS